MAARVGEGSAGRAGSAAFPAGSGCGLRARAMTSWRPSKRGRERGRMARVVVIGATGHIGSYLVPRLVEAGHVVVTVTRGEAKPYRASRAWDAVEQIALDRAALEAEDQFGAAILATEPDIVVDMICFTPASVRQLHAALAGRISHYLCIGTIWTYGHSRIVPTPEHAPEDCPSATTASRKRPSKPSCWTRPARRGFPRRSFTPGISSAPGGRRSTRPGTSTRRSSPRWPAASG